MRLPSRIRLNVKRIFWATKAPVRGGFYTRPLVSPTWLVHNSAREEGSETQVNAASQARQAAIKEPKEAVSGAAALPLHYPTGQVMTVASGHFATARKRCPPRELGLQKPGATSRLRLCKPRSAKLAPLCAVPPCYPLAGHSCHVTRGLGSCHVWHVWSASKSSRGSAVQRATRASEGRARGERGGNEGGARVSAEAWCSLFAGHRQKRGGMAEQRPREGARLSERAPPP